MPMRDPSNKELLVICRSILESRGLPVTGSAMDAVIQALRMGVSIGKTSASRGSGDEMRGRQSDPRIDFGR